MNKKVEKIRLVLEIIQFQRKLHPLRETFNIPPERFSKIPTLKDYNGLILTFKEIEKETKGNVLISISENEDSAAKEWMPVPPIITAHIEDFQEFDKYRKQISQSGEKTPALILEEGQLYRADDKERKLVYSMKLDKLPYKIACYLVEEKRYVQTKELADRFDESPQEIRKTIGEIRQLINERLKIPGNKIIESNNSGAGYRTKNIKLKQT